MEENMVCANFAHTTQHGAIKGISQTQNVKFYNLDVIISVGYRVKSHRGVHFRIWATQKLMAELFQTTIPNINMHLKSIYDEGELEEQTTIKDFLIVQKEGNREVKRKHKFYKYEFALKRV